MIIDNSLASSKSLDSLWDSIPLSEEVKEFIEGAGIGFATSLVFDIALKRINLPLFKPLLEYLSLYGTIELGSKALKGEKIIECTPKFYGEICGGVFYAGFSQLVQGLRCIIRSPYLKNSSYSSQATNSSNKLLHKWFDQGEYDSIESLRNAGLTGECRLFGFTKKEYLQAMKDFKAMSQEERISLALQEAEALDCRLFQLSPDADPKFWFTYSPFGWHRQDFLKTREWFRAIPALKNLEAPQIACYGGGFHRDVDFIHAMIPPHHPLKEAWIARVRGCSRKVSPLGGESHEPGELAALFLRGKKDGKIYVFDDQEIVLEALKRSEFSFTNITSTLDPSTNSAQLKAYWENEILTKGKAYRIVTNGEINGHILQGFSADFQAEASQIIGHQACLATSTKKIDFSKTPFDLSVWLDGYYFLPSPLRIKSWCHVIKNTKKNGLILSDIGNKIHFSEEHLRQLGLKLIERIPAAANPFGREVNSSIYQKILESDIVDILTGLET